MIILCTLYSNWVCTLQNIINNLVILNPTILMAKIQSHNQTSFGSLYNGREWQ